LHSQSIQFSAVCSPTALEDFFARSGAVLFTTAKLQIMAEPPSRVSAGGAGEPVAKSSAGVADIRAVMNYPLVKVSNSATSNSISTLHILM
jgi:hypothetical protein